MTQASRPTFELSLGEVSLRAPETPLYLELAAQVIETRRRELEDAAAPGEPVSAQDAPDSDATHRGGVTAAAPAPPAAAAADPASAATDANASAPLSPSAERNGGTVGAPAGRRARWFRDRYPRVQLEDGSFRVMRSSEALQDLLRERGLQPHPRGDASMLLWQVRNRLGLAIDQVDA